MKAAGKWTLYIVGGLIGLIIILVVAAFLTSDYLIKMGIIKGGTYALKVPVDVNNVHMSVARGSIEINGLKIANPEGFELPDLLTMSNAQASVKVGSLTGDTIEMDYIKLSGVSLTIEQKGLSTNLQQILNNLPKSKEQAQQAPGKNLVIKTLEITDVNVTMKLLPLPGKLNTVTLKLAPIRMENLGTDDRLSMAELVSKVLVAIAAGVTKQGADLIPSDIRESIGSGLGGAQKLIESGSKGVMDLGKGVSEGVKGIFNRKPADANKK